MGNAEEHAPGVVELHVDVVQHPSLPPAIAGEVERLLRRPSTLNGHGRLGEERPAAAQALDLAPGVGGMLRRVVAAHAVLAEGFSSAINAVPIQSQARGDHEGAIAEDAPIFEVHLVAVRLKGGGRALHPGNAIGDQVRFLARDFRGIEMARAHQRKPGLIVVGLGRLHHGNGQIVAALHEARRRTQTRGTAAHDHHIEGFGRFLRNRRRRLWREARKGVRHGSEVMPRPLGLSENGVHGKALTPLQMGPGNGDPAPAATVREHFRGVSRAEAVFQIRER